MVKVANQVDTKDQTDETPEDRAYCSAFSECSERPGWRSLFPYGFIGKQETGAETLVVIEAGATLYSGNPL
jgi:hypothetical protein